MDAALVEERVDPPGLLEVLAVLIVCAGVLVGLAVVDDRAARKEAARAHEVLAERASRAGQRASREAMTAPAVPAGARTDRVGREGSPIVIPAGPAWGPGTSVVSHTRRARRDDAPPPPQVIRRIEGPRTATAESAIPEPPRLREATRPVSAASASPQGARTDAGPVLLLLMGGAGLSLAGGGLRLLSRRSA